MNKLTLSFHFILISSLCLNTKWYNTYTATKQKGSFRVKRLLGGSRIIKTGVAVFLTAWICELLGWPPVFAVITAIVTIEPTVSDSIKKGMVRFPASAIGSLYAVIFISLFGNSPITYTLAAVLTIATCFKLNLHAGLLVATLTSVAMVEVIHEHFFISFLIRLGTTTVGLVVSTVVNMFILPPDYREDITTNIGKIKKPMAKLMNKVYTDMIDGKETQMSKSAAILQRIENKIKNTGILIQFQKDELKYHPLVASEKSLFLYLEKQAKLLQRMHDNLDYFVHQPAHHFKWTKEEKETIRIAVRELADRLQQENNFTLETHHESRNKITTMFWKNGAKIIKNREHHPASLSPELVLLFELLTFYDLVEQFHHTSNLDKFPL